MNFIEACQVMANGQMIKNKSTCHVNRFKDGVMQASVCLSDGSLSDAWSDVFSVSNFHPTQDCYELFVEKRKNVGLIDLSSENKAHRPSQRMSHDWYLAMTTFYELKNHRLAVPAVDGKEQWYICIDYDLDGLDVSGESDLSVKIDYLSPFFYKEDNAEQAVYEIGKIRLMHMFKTLQGVK